MIQCRTGEAIWPGRGRRRAAAGFTLIELSIVLVIIGLIVGGVLVGQDLIKAAEVRAQITQIEKFNTAVNTFYGKYNALPGDMSVASATQFGFAVGANCVGGQGQRDGNGFVDGWVAPYNLLQTAGETGLFWQDLSSSTAGNLIEGQVPGAGAASVNCTSALTLSASGIGDYMPSAKIGHGTFVYVYENGEDNYYGIAAVTSTVLDGTLNTSSTIPVMQAYNIDRKMDDGLPTTGNVVAVVVNGEPPTTSPAPNAGSDSASTCYNTTTHAYSVSFNNGAGANCALSFQFQ